MRSLLASLVLLAAPAGMFAQNLLINPSFDTLTSGSGALVDVDFTGSGNLDGWGVYGIGANGGTTSVDDSTLYGLPQDGTRFVALGTDGSGNGRGLFQTFAATAGQTYAVSIYARYFGASENVRGGLVVEDATESFTSIGDVTFAVSPSGNDEALEFAWKKFSFEFTAVNTGIHRLVLRDFTVNDTAPNTDLLLDNASLTAIPEPSAFTALSGLAGLGWACARRRRAVRR